MKDSNSSEANRELTGYIWYYNAERRHSSLGYATPIEFEAQQSVQNLENALAGKPEAPDIMVHEIAEFF